MFKSISTRIPMISRRWLATSQPPLPPSKSFIPREAFEKVAKASTPQPPPPASPASSQEILIGRIFSGVLIAGSTYGLYALTHPLDDPEPSFIATAPIWKKVWLRARYRTMSMYKDMVDPQSDHLLPDPFEPGSPYYKPYTLVIELDKNLVYSTWSKDHGWTVAKRPWADYFLAYLTQFYEIVVFTSQTVNYAAPIIDKLDPYQAIMYKLYRDSTVYDLETGDHVKDLRLLNRDLRKVILMDPTRRNYEKMQPENAIEMTEWKGDPNDTYLLDMIPFLETLAVSKIEDTRAVLESYRGRDIPKTFASNMAQIQRMQREEYERKSASASTVSSTATNGGESGGWTGAIVSAMMSVFGLGSTKIGAPPPSEKDYALMQAQHYAQTMSEIDRHRKLVEEENKQRQHEHEEMMKKLGNVRVTLWDLITMGPDQAILTRADPEVREYLEKNQQAMQPQEQQ